MLSMKIFFRISENISEMVEMMEGVMGRALGFGSLRGLNEKLNNVLKSLFLIKSKK